MASDSTSTSTSESANEDETGSGSAENFVFGWNPDAFTSDHHTVLSEYLLIFSVLLVVAIVIQHYWFRKWKITLVPEAGATIFLGWYWSCSKVYPVPNRVYCFTS